MLKSGYQKNTRITLAIVCVWIFFLNTAQAKDIDVCSSCKEKTIAAAVSKADSGDRVLVHEGIYRENFININKPIQLLAKGKVVIDGMMKKEIITIKSSYVTVSGFTIMNCGTADVHEYSGIRVISSRYVEISKNYFYNNYFAVYIAGSHHCTVKNNIIIGRCIIESLYGNGIHLWKCDSSFISGNVIFNQRDGIYFEFVKESKISNNISKYNLRYGLHFMFSDGNIYTSNLFEKNASGVAVMYTHRISMLNNTFRDNRGASSYGLLLKEITYSTIKGNTFANNTSGLYMEGAVKNRITGNQFKNNGWALRILSDCTLDTIKSNNFTGNTFDVSTNGSNNENYFTNNYWDKYKGYDLNKDHIGDIPFRPVSMFSMIIEEVPPAIILLRSFITGLLDEIERYFPSFIPETLLDSKPMMRAVDRK